MWDLDKICRLITKPDVLNALHACREGHPLNKMTMRPWLNAYVLCLQQPSYVVPISACLWLRTEAFERGEFF